MGELYASASLLLENDLRTTRASSRLIFAEEIGEIKETEALPCFAVMSRAQRSQKITSRRWSVNLAQPHFQRPAAESGI